MKCINKIPAVRLTAFLLTINMLSGCGTAAYSMPYSMDHPVSSYRMPVTQQTENNLAVPFASKLCIASGDITGTSPLDLADTGSAGLFCLDSSETLYAKNIFEQLHPASLTKVMTALVALKYASPDDLLTASENVKITEEGATTCGLEAGDQMTLDQALHLLLINSSNDVAVMIAENVGGSLEGFSEMMNAEAASLGATNSHFVNPHGLTADQHFVTAYDMYLIFQAASSYNLFCEIIHMESYSTVYKDREGNDKEISVKSTNQYLRGEKTAPESVTVIGGKTGTTKAAQSCLILLAKDAAGQSYISVILRAVGRDILYEQMSGLLDQITSG